MLRKARTLMDTAPLALISRSHSAGQARLAMCSMEFLFRRSSRKYRFLASALRGMKSMTLSWSHSLSKRGQLQYGRRRGLGTRFNRHAPHTTTAQPTHCSKPARPSMRLWYSLSSRRSRRESKPWMVMIELYDKSIVRSFGYCGRQPALLARSNTPSPSPPHSRQSPRTLCRPLTSCMFLSRQSNAYSLEFGSANSASCDGNIAMCASEPAIAAPAHTSSPQRGHRTHSPRARASS